MTSTIIRKCNGILRDAAARPTNVYLQTPQDALCELSAILATGIHRLRANRPVTPESAPIPTLSSLEPVATFCPDWPGRQRERTPET